MRIVTAILLGFALSASAFAQTAPNPVLEHFRAYRAAIAAGDMATAETEAAAALAASEARDGDGGRTAVLALNLAALRLELGKRAEAIEPANRALALATTRENSGVDTRMARLLVARATLSADAAQKDAYHALLAEARGEAALAGDVYLAAVDLGGQEMRDHRFAQSAAAWRVAVDHAHAAPHDVTIARAEMLTLEGVALIYSAVGQHDVPRVRPEEIAAHASLHEAYLLTRSAALERRPGAEISTQDRVSATAYAWHRALDVRLGSLSRPWVAEDRDVEALEFETPRCPVQVLARPLPDYPEDALEDLEVGVVILHLHFDEAGAITQRRIAAAVPANGPFIDAVTSVYERWTVRWGRDAPEGCIRSYVLRAPIIFRLPS